MARRKKHTKKRVTHRRRKMSGIGDLDFTAIALTIGGAVAARMIATKFKASTNTTFSKLAPYAGVAIGIILPMVSKNAMLKAISIGMVAGGGVELLGADGLKVISGFENTVSGRVGYPYNVLPYKKQVAGFMQNGEYVSKPNFSGSGKSQLNVLSGVDFAGAGDGASGVIS